MKSFYKTTARVGFIRACLRLIEDPNRSKWQRILLAFAPLFVLWVLSPFDLLPEAFLGPLGLADDGIIIITFVLLIRLAVSFYSEKKYVPPTKDKNGNDIIDL